MEVKGGGIPRKQALAMDEVIRQYISSMKLSAGLNTQRIFAAWDEASGASKYTIRRFFRSGKLYVTVSSSMVRTRLSMQSDSIIKKINEMLKADILFTDDEKVSYVEELILK